MEKKVSSERGKRARKFFLLAPVFAWPLLTILFWAFGGGRDNKARAAEVVKGFNLDIPGVHLPNRKGWTKVDYYKEAREDSLRQAAKLRSEDGYARRIGLATDSAAAVPVKEVRERLERIKKLMSGGEGRQTRPSFEAMTQRFPAIGMPRVEVVQKRKEPDPDIMQLNAMVDKLVTLVHPETKRDSVKVQRLAIPRDVMAVKVSVVLDSLDRQESLVTGDSLPSMDAVVPDEQTLVGGARLTLELGHDLLAGGALIPRGTPVYGRVSLSGERLLVTIRSIAYSGHLYPVSLDVIDQDGLPGIYIPDMPSTESVKETAGEDINSLGPELVSPTLATQAASAGIQAARSLLSKKIRLVRVSIPSGYRLILQESKKS